MRAAFRGEERETLREQLGRDFARSERVVPGNAPDFLDTRLTAEENRLVREQVREKTAVIRGQGVKLQHFAAVFRGGQATARRRVIIFLYLTRTGEGMRVEEWPLPGDCRT